MELGKIERDVVGDVVALACNRKGIERAGHTPIGPFGSLLERSGELISRNQQRQQESELDVRVANNEAEDDNILSDLRFFCAARQSTEHELVGG
jgi:hypothetical protein